MDNSWLFEENSKGMTPYGISTTRLSKITKHYFLTNFAKTSAKNPEIQIEKPIPVFNPFPIENVQECEDVLSIKSTLYNQFELIQKSSSNTTATIMKRLQTKKTGQMSSNYVDFINSLPSNYDDDATSYSKGPLDCISFQNQTIVVWSGHKQPVHIVDINNPKLNDNINVQSRGVVYAIECLPSRKRPLIAIRHKSLVSLYKLSNSDRIEHSFLWNFKTKGYFYDMAFNKFRKNCFSTIDNNLELKVFDLKVDKLSLEHKFNQSCVSGNDKFSQIQYYDANTLCYMNRCCVNLLDLRSLEKQTLCTKSTLMECDTLCTLVCNPNHENLCVSSTHNFLKFDVRALKCSDFCVHLLTTPPFVSSVFSENDRELYCLIGEDYKDKIAFCNTNTSMSSSYYVPNIKDTYRALKLTKRVRYSDYIDRRLTLPCLGAKLFKEKNSDNISLFTVNSGGDVFQQSIVEEGLCTNSNYGKLTDWIEALPRNFKLEVNNLADMTILVNSLSCHVVKKKKTKLYSQNNLQEFVENEQENLSSCVERPIGKLLNAVWEIE